MMSHAIVLRATVLHCGACALSLRERQGAPPSDPSQDSRAPPLVAWRSDTPATRLNNRLPLRLRAHFEDLRQAATICGPRCTRPWDLVLLPTSTLDGITLRALMSLSMDATMYCVARPFLCSGLVL